MTVKMIFRAKALKCHSIERVFQLVARGLKNKIVIGNVFVERVGFNIANYFDLKKYTRFQSKDTIYHVTGDVHYAVFALPRKRCILTIHDCVFLQRRTGLKKWLIKKIYLDWPVSYTKYITTISDKTKKEIVELTGCDPQKIKVIKNPVAPEIYLSAKPFNAEKPVILFMGSTPNKNLDRVMEALKGIPCKLNIIGNPTQQQRDKLKEYRIDSVVEKDISDAEIAQRYDAADLVLFPSLYEGFGLPVIEGFKAGKPVITSYISPMKELASDAAWLVDPQSSDSIRSAVMDVITKAAIREGKVKAGLKQAEDYSFENVALQYQLLYNHVSLKCAE